MLNDIMKNYKEACLELSQDKLSQAPECGYILAYFQTGMEFGTYHKVMCMKDSVRTIDIKSACLEQKKYNDGAKLLELHLFDRLAEYRAVYTQNDPKYGYLERIVKDDTVERKLDVKELEGLKTKKVEYQLLYGNSYEYFEERGGILAVQDGTKKFFYLPDPKGADLYLKVVNYIDYDDDMLVIVNYRLAGIYTPKKSKAKERDKERGWEYLWV